jgi:glycylpeptide N-tetradecanoyltransferase
MFRFDYSIEFIRWALCPPTYVPNWHIGVRGGEKKKLFGFVSGIPISLVVRKHSSKLDQ